MKKLICEIFGHKYKMYRRITPSIREIYCSRCNKKFAMNDREKCILPLDGELIDLHDDMLGI